MGANFEMDPRWIFFTVDQFLTVSREITYARFAMGGDRERERQRKLPRQGKIYLEKVRSFYEILSLFLYEMFS